MDVVCGSAPPCSVSFSTSVPGEGDFQPSRSSPPVFCYSTTCYLGLSLYFLFSALLCQLCHSKLCLFLLALCFLLFHQFRDVMCYLGLSLCFLFSKLLCQLCHSKLCLFLVCFHRGASWSAPLQQSRLKNCENDIISCRVR